MRAAGEDRFVTATVVADLLSAYDPAYLGVDLQAVDSVVWNGALGRYEITFSDLSYSINSDTATVSIAGSTPGFISSSSVSGMLLLYTDDTAGTEAQREFDFAVFDDIE